MTNAEAEPETLTRRWFGLVPPKTDRSQAGLVKAIHAACVFYGGPDDPMQFNSPADMCETLAEFIRRQLKGSPASVRVFWIGCRMTSRRTALVIETDWGLVEGVEHALSFHLFKPGEAASAASPSTKGKL